MFQWWHMTNEGDKSCSSFRLPERTLLQVPSKQKIRAAVARAPLKGNLKIRKSKMCPFLESFRQGLNIFIYISCQSWVVVRCIWPVTFIMCIHAFPHHHHIIFNLLLLPFDLLLLWLFWISLSGRGAQIWLETMSGVVAGALLLYAQFTVDLNSAIFSPSKTLNHLKIA